MPPSLRPVPDLPAESAQERMTRLSADADRAQMEYVSGMLAEASVLCQTFQTIRAYDRVPAGLRGEIEAMGRDMARRLTTIAAIRGRK